MKSFKFKYSTLVWALLCVVTALSIIGLAWNVFSAIEYYGHKPLKVTTSIIIGVLCLALIIIAVGVMLYGRYKIKDNYLKCCFGIIVSKYKISEIVGITLFKKSNKLVLYFSDDKYTVAVISPTLYEDFVLSLRKVNPKITYDVKIEGEDLPKQ